MKELKKMNLSELRKLSRVEMKNIMAGSGGGPASGNKCCWDAYPSSCSVCQGGWICSAGAHAVAC